tara:strand:+ start:401 stop:634 length:234 start_codon:yes stop_codon:yes gene_type:complete
MNTKITISNVTRANQYLGAYIKIFKILEADLIFSERYETDSSVGFVDGSYYLEIEGTIDYSEEEKINKIKNVTITQL